MKKINYSFHKAIHYIVRKNEGKRAKWLKDKLPEIYREHIEAGYRIFYQDEVGFQTEGTLSYSWAPKGEKNRNSQQRSSWSSEYDGCIRNW